MGNRNAKTPVRTRVKAWIKRRCYPGCRFTFCKRDCIEDLYLTDGDLHIVDEQFSAAIRRGDIEQVDRGRYRFKGL